MNKHHITPGIAVLLILVVGFNGCTQEDALGGLGYVNREYGFGFNPPEGWNIRENWDAKMVFFAPEEEGEILIVAVMQPRSLVEYSSLQEFNDDTFNASYEELTNYTWISGKETIINGMNAYETLYTYFDDVVTYTTHMSKEIVIEKNNFGYFIGFTAPLSKYDDYISIVDQSFNSFTII